MKNDDIERYTDFGRQKSNKKRKFGEVRRKLCLQKFGLFAGNNTERGNVVKRL